MMRMPKDDSHYTRKPDYFIAQIPPGGQRGYASVLLLDYFEKQTGIPTRFLFPNVTASSVGILITSALYLPHPENKNVARMTAGQLSEIFPTATARLPKRPALGNRKNDRTPLEHAIYPYIGEAKLSDFMGTVFFSSHAIGAVSKSYKIYAKKINPVTNQSTYHGDENTRVMDIVLAGTAIPAVFPSHNKQVDLAFAEVPAPAMIEMQRQYAHHLQGAFIRVGNFRSKTHKSHQTLIESGVLAQTFRAARDFGTADMAYSQTIETANSLFGEKYVFNLEQEIDTSKKTSPQTSGIITTPEQFEKIRRNINKFIHDNKDILAQLADRAAEIARATYIDQDLSLVEYPLDPVADYTPQKEPRFKRRAKQPINETVVQPS